MKKGLKVNSVNVKLGPAVKYSNIPTNKRGHKMSVCVGCVDEDGKAGYWECTGKVITGLGYNETEAFKFMIEGCIKTTDNLLNTDTIKLINDVIDDHNHCMIDRNYSGKYYFDKEDRMVARA